MIGLSTEVLLKMEGTSSGTASGDWGQALGAVVSSCRNLEAGGAETGVGGTTVYEINVAALETDSQEFPTAKEAIVSRYERLRSKHAPAGSQTFKRDATARECNASSYTVVAVEHADAAVQAFASERYTPGFALARPMLEAVVKQFMIGDYKSEDDGWQSIPDIRVNQRSLSRLAAHLGPPSRAFEHRAVMEEPVAGAQRLRAWREGTTDEQPHQREQRAPIPRGLVLVGHAPLHHVRAALVHNSIEG